MKGHIQVYTGDGKGKTTASIGLACRASGAGFRVAFIQFDKGHDPSRDEHYAERNTLRAIPNIDLYPTGMERIQEDGTFRFGVTEEDRAEASRGLEIARNCMESGDYPLVILDDILGGISYGLLDLQDVLELTRIQKSRGDFELVLTGRNAPEEIVREADLVTEMKKIKHYFDDGQKARRGIEF